MWACARFSFLYMACVDPHLSMCFGAEQEEQDEQEEQEEQGGQEEQEGRRLHYIPYEVVGPPISAEWKAAFRACMFGMRALNAATKTRLQMYQNNILRFNKSYGTCACGWSHSRTNGCAPSTYKGFAEPRRRDTTRRPQPDSLTRSTVACVWTTASRPPCRIAGSGTRGSTASLCSSPPTSRPRSSSRIRATARSAEAFTQVAMAPAAPAAEEGERARCTRRRRNDRIGRLRGPGRFRKRGRHTELPRPRAWGEATCASPTAATASVTPAWRCVGSGGARAGRTSASAAGRPSTAACSARIVLQVGRRC